MTRIDPRRTLFLAALISAMPMAFAETPATSLPKFRNDLIAWYRASVDPLHTNEIILFSTPLPIDTALLSNDANVAIQSLLLLTDAAPEAKPIYSGTGRRTADVYSVILQNRAVEVRQMTPEDTRTLRNANRVLLRYQTLLSRIVYWYLYGAPAPLEYSHKYSVYLTFFKQEAALRTKLLRESDPALRAALMKSLADLQIQWTAHGHKDEVEHALTEMRAIHDKDPEKFWAEAGSLLRNNSRLIGGSLLPLTQAAPPPGEWSSDSGWSAWHWGTSSALVKRIDIQRKWLSLDVLTTHPWSWADGQFKQEHLLISSGTGFASQHPDQEMMPLLPVQLLLTKNILADGHVLTGSSPMIAAMACKILPRLPTL